ncbi:MAG: 2-deoxyribose-5-phosphate aldolase, partial [Acidobacteria bacterium]|nr:2-deoxyribose-5-phosphate aldolase [Acidobacteriota bacterium]
VPDVVVKVILETALWSPAVVRAAAGAALDGGADMVKTSTGFHPAGGATVEAVEVLREAVGARAGVKASGGIRDLATALAMVDAGADRLGCSATEQLLAEYD